MLRIPRNPQKSSRKSTKDFTQRKPRAAAAPFTAVPNAILDDVASMTPAEVVVLMIVTRLTVGWQRPDVLITTPALASRCGLSPSTVKRAVAGLVERGLILKHSRGARGTVYTLADCDLPEPTESAHQRPDSKRPKKPTKPVTNEKSRSDLTPLKEKILRSSPPKSPRDRGDGRERVRRSEARKILNQTHPQISSDLEIITETKSERATGAAAVRTLRLIEERGIDRIEKALASTVTGLADGRVGSGWAYFRTLVLRGELRDIPGGAALGAGDRAGRRDPGWRLVRGQRPEATPPPEIDEDDGPLPLDEARARLAEIVASLSRGRIEA